MKKNTFRFLTINGSPHGKFGNTEKLINMILDPIKQTYNLDVKTIYLSKEDILPCEGCTRCFKKGDCSLKNKDKAETIIDLFYWADIILIGSPVYVLSITSYLKTFFERCARITHRPDLEGKYGVAVSTSAGLGEKEVAEYIKTVMEAMGINIVGQITATAFFMGRFHNVEELNKKVSELGQNLVDAVNNKKEITFSDYEAKRREKFSSLIRIPSVGQSLFKADYEFWENRKEDNEL